MALEGFSKLEVMIQLNEPLAGTEIIKMVKEAAGEFPSIKNVTFEIRAAGSPINPEGNYQYFTVETKTRQYQPLPKEAADYHIKMTAGLYDRFYFPAMPLAHSAALYAFDIFTGQGNIKNEIKDR